MTNPAEIPFTIESLTVLESRFGFVTRYKGNQRYTRERLIYRMAKELLHYKLQDALAQGVKQEPMKHADRVKAKR